VIAELESAWPFLGKITDVAVQPSRITDFSSSEWGRLMPRHISAFSKPSHIEQAAPFQTHILCTAMEAVASAAAVVQFLDVAFRLSSALDKLYSDVRHVPERFQLLHTDLQQQIAVARVVEAYQQRGSAISLASSTFEASLLAYIADAEHLCTTLVRLLSGQKDGRIRRVWKSLCATRKQEEIEQLCDRLERHKSTLTLWLGGANLTVYSLACCKLLPPRQMSVADSHITGSYHRLRRRP
jgi:hypothetical protein